MICPSCKQETTFKQSPRKHGREGRIFVICKSCDTELQAITRYGKVQSVWGYKGGTNVVTLRLSDAEMTRRASLKAKRLTDREIYLVGLDVSEVKHG
jgi:hypothetical protein